MPADLTAKQRKIMDWLKAQPSSLDVTLRDLADAFGFKSHCAGLCHLNALEQKGYITRDRDRSRGIRLVDANSDLVELLQDCRLELTRYGLRDLMAFGRAADLNRRIDGILDRLESTPN